MKNVLFVLGVLLSAGMFCACSNSDEIESNPLSSGELTNEADEADSKIQISYSLLNDYGLPTSSFKYGEDICFELTITNKSDKVIFIYNDFILDEDLFRVYLEDGTDMGTPWTSFGSNYVAIGIEPKGSMRIACNWIKAFSTHQPLTKKKDFNPLPCGKYYTSFKVYYRNLDKIQQDEFLEKELYTTFDIQ